MFSRAYPMITRQYMKLARLLIACKTARLDEGKGNPQNFAYGDNIY